MGVDPLKIGIIVGTTRQQRFSEKVAAYLFQETRKNPKLKPELLDLREYPLPFFDEAITPSRLAATGGAYDNDMVKKWTKKIGEQDGFIMVTGEYNHGYPAVLKNAIDYVYNEWHRKPVGFASYGSSLGARAIEQLRQVVIELQMVPIRSAIQIPPTVFLEVIKQQTLDLSVFDQLKSGPMDKVEIFFDELEWYTKTLKQARG